MIINAPMLIKMKIIIIMMKFIMILIHGIVQLIIMVVIRMMAVILFVLYDAYIFVDCDANAEMGQ